MIPKIIHYCWFGRNPLPLEAQKCILSWQKHCSDYEIKEWNESNFDINSCRYVNEAYKAGKWAFITDYVRLYVMVNYGGVYMDTDVELIKPIDEFLKLRAFSGFEGNCSISTGIMGCEKGFPLFAELLHDYDKRNFINEDGTYDLTTNVETITKICITHGLVMNNKFQTVDGFTLYPFDYFCAKDFTDGLVKATENTHAIHHFAGSWVNKSMRKSIKIARWFIKKFGYDLGYTLGRFFNFPFRVLSKFEILGCKKTFSFIVKKIFN